MINYIMTTEAKLEQMKQAYIQVCQQYHLLANIINRDRHISVKWTECNEMTCKLQRDFISSIQNNE